MRVSRFTQPWTPEEKAELLRLRDEEGMRFIDIAEKLGRNSLSSVEVQYRKLRGKSK